MQIGSKVGCEPRGTRIQDIGLAGYYKVVITTDSLEWNLFQHYKHMDNGSPTPKDRRHLFEEDGDKRTSLFNATNRAAGIGVSCLLVAKLPEGNYQTFIRRRSMNVARSPGMYHVLPASMHQTFYDANTEYSVESCVLREFAEEIMGRREALKKKSGYDIDRFNTLPEVKSLKKMLHEDHSATLYTTAIGMELTTLRPEICTLLLIDDSSFLREYGRQFKFNFESERLKKSDSQTSSLSDFYSSKLSSINATNAGLITIEQGMKCLREIGLIDNVEVDIVKKKGDT